MNGTLVRHQLVHKLGNKNDHQLRYKNGDHKLGTRRLDEEMTRIGK